MDTQQEWRQHFLGQLLSPFWEESQTLLSKKELLVPIVTKALEAWPSLRLTSKHFLEYMAHCMMNYPSLKGVEDWFEHLQAADLFLACACVEGEPHALTAFEESYYKLLEGLARRFVRPPLSKEDLLQSLREKLFVGSSNNPPKIALYSGQGFLENWLRVTSSRTFLDIVRSTSHAQHQERQFEEDCLHALPEQVLDFELEFLKQEYRSHFKAAFHEAIASLSPRERNLLRQYLVGGLSIDQIGAIYNIHRSTAARRLAKTRRHLLTSTQERLMQHLQISEDEYESIMRLIQSRLEVSFHRLLRIDEAGTV